MKLTEQQLIKLTEMIEITTQKKINEYTKENSILSKADIVFAGDSMIDYMPVKTLFPQYEIINRGIAGSTTKSFLANLDKIITPLKPKALFISIGSNDLVMFNQAVEQVIENIKTVLSKIKEKLPHTTLYYLSTTPVVAETEKIYKQLYIGGRTNLEQQTINQALKQENIQYINVYDVLIDKNGYLERSYTADGIHLNQTGYQVYAKQIEPYINEII